MNNQLTIDIAKTLVTDARTFWKEDRPGWPLDRALRAYITYETAYEWGYYDRDTDTFIDGEAYEWLFQAVMESP